MNNLVQTLVTGAICILLAIVAGYMFANPDSYQSIGFVGILFGALSIPIVLKWHYPALLFSWNASILAFFLPGQTQLWMLMSVVSLFVSVLAFTLNRGGQATFMNVRSLTWTLGIFLLIVLITARFRTGFGIRALGGGSVGGRYYFYILFAVMGYFALSCREIPRDKVHRYFAFFVLGHVTIMMSNLIYLAGDKFYWLYLVFPLSAASTQIQADFSGADLVRLSGFAFGSYGIFAWVLGRYGVRDVFSIRKWWLPLVMLVVIAMGLMGGFRSVLVTFALVFAIQFYLEGLIRSRYLFVVVGVIVISLAVALPFASKMPLSVQRVLSVFPVDIDSGVRMNAMQSTEWRLKMWNALLPEIPDYLWLGKGYRTSDADLYLTQEAQKRGLAQDYEVSILAGDYHSGPLSLLITFAIPGLLAFIAFSVACLRVLYRNYKFSPPDLRIINSCLLALFLARYVSFWIIYGAIATDLPFFVGIIGFSIALNGGVRGKSKPQPAPSTITFAHQRAIRV